MLTIMYRRKKVVMQSQNNRILKHVLQWHWSQRLRQQLVCGSQLTCLVFIHIYNIASPLGD